MRTTMAMMSTAAKMAAPMMMASECARACNNKTTALVPTQSSFHTHTHTHHVPYLAHFPQQLCHINCHLVLSFTQEAFNHVKCPKETRKGM